jgi:hypothetical protein
VTPAVASQSFAPGRAYWNQRMALARCRERIIALSGAVNRPSDLAVYQFAQLVASVLDFAPDLILELGRGTGNSLCAFTEAANQLHAPCRVISLCNTADWHTVTVPDLRQLVPDSWFSPVEAIQGDILEFDYPKKLAGAKRVLIFWDAHGFEVAECVLGRILPIVSDRQHLVFMHDMSDARYSPETNNYGERGLWKGANAEDARLRLGIVDSAVAQSISIQDFAGRNRITLDSAEHSVDVEINQVPGRAAEMRALLGDELFSLLGHWFWFTLNQHPGPYTFPRWTPPPKPA